MTTNQTALFPDGYNGHKIECDLEPLMVWATTVKLRVTGSSYLFKWVFTHEWEKAKRKAQKANIDATID